MDWTQDAEKHIHQALDKAIGAYQNYQAGKISRAEFNHDLDFIAAVTTQQIVEALPEEAD